MKVAVGKDVEAACRKCGEVWHVIMAMDGAKITKVQCKQCSAYHRYRPPEGESPVDASAKPAARKKAASPRKTSTRKTTGKTGKKRASKKSPYAEPLVEPDLSRPIRQYTMNDRYTPGDRVVHRKFGEGVVEMSPGDGKINVFFEDGRRTLAHDR